METWLTLQIPKIFNKNKITVNINEASEIYSKIGYHVAKLMDNILALISTQSIIKDPKAHTVLPRHVQYILDYVQKTCYPKQEIQKGGIKNQDLWMIISYNIIETTEYKELFPSTEIVTRLMELGLNISNHTLNIVKRILNMHVNCLMMDFYERQPITLKKVEKIFGLKRHSVFY
uniref:Uncharacterized protein n=1 Tax=viral metagenome TaxID=1070528 RepID=A0A6C0CR34_9ZZZZ